jgi:sensor histidine kinase YesM
MDDNFTYSIDTSLIQDLDDVNIPPMLTQPFIENSIEHGFRGKTNHGHIDVEYKLIGESDLQITVTDNGKGINQNPQGAFDSTRPSAIQITKERLLVLNKSKKKKVQFRISDISDENGSETGTKVVFTVPLGWF